MINYEDFKKVEMKVGEIKEVELVDGSEKLLKLKVLFADEERQILSGIRKFFDDYNVLVGKKVPFVINLEPRKMMGLESQGMILAVNDDEGNFSLLEVDNKIKSGSSVS
jgi:methionyl-tRNA synthetase